MDFDGIADFITLADCRSFSRAAEIRRVTQSAFSRRIQALETTVGATLIDRSVTPVVLTRAGERFLSHARILAETLNQAVDEAQSYISAVEDPVYIVTPPSLSYSFFPAWYRGLQRKIDGLQVSLSVQRGSRCVEAIRNSLADLAIIMMSDKVSACFDLDGLESRVIGEDRLVAVKAKFLHDREDDFLSHEKNSYMESLARHVLESADAAARMKPVFESASVELLRAMALAGFGTAILPESLVSDDLAQEFLIPALNDGAGLPCQVLIVRSSKLDSAKGSKVWELAQSS